MKAPKKQTAYFNYIDCITLPSEIVPLCSHSGSCDDDVNRCMEFPSVKKELAKIDPLQLVKELKEYGAWDAEDLEDHTQNLKRILWIACADIQDNNN